VGLDVFVHNGLIDMEKGAPAVSEWRGGVVPLSLQSPSISTSLSTGPAQVLPLSEQFLVEPNKPTISQVGLLFP
jgi:hypothetical protein